MAQRSPRVLALGLVVRPSDGRWLVRRGADQVSGAGYARPLGGGVDYGETGAAAVAREFLEELRLEVRVGPRLGVIENLFDFEGARWHEIVLVYAAAFEQDAGYAAEHHDVYDEAGASVVDQTLWRRPDELAEAGLRLTPDGIEDLAATP